MGGVCSRGMSREYPDFPVRSFAYAKKLNRRGSLQNKEDPNSYFVSDDSINMSERYDSEELRIPNSSELKPSKASKFMPSKALGRVGYVGFERAVEVIDALGSSMSNLNPGSGFSAHITSSRNKISILSFEVANTIAKGAKLLESLSKDNIQFLKDEVLLSEGVQKLISTDMNELLCIASEDKREELDVFSGEVIRFGNLCKDPQWHNLGRYFSTLDSNSSVHKQFKEEAELAMSELTDLAHHTSELYHELQALDRFEQDYHQKLEEMDSLNLPRRGEGIMMLESELKHQRKLVRSLKRRSLWSKTLEEVVEKLVDIVVFVHQEIVAAIGSRGKNSKKCQTLGKAGLALHYANIICQIDNMACRPTSVPSSTRETLYQGLPSSVKSALRHRLQKVEAPQLSVAQMKAEMEKTLHWLVPLASNTTKAHQGFGWVGEWANTGAETGKKGGNNCVRLQTLYHANIEKTEMSILELVTWLHRLISEVRRRENGMKPISLHSPNSKGTLQVTNKIRLSQAEKDMLEEVRCRRGGALGRSRSQGFVAAASHKRKQSRVHSVSRSAGSSPREEAGAVTTASPQRPHHALDVIDGLKKAP